MISGVVFVLFGESLILISRITSHSWVIGAALQGWVTKVISDRRSACKKL